MIVRVVPDIPGLDKNFDYSVPPPLEQLVRPGAVVRVELNRRRVDAWVVECGEFGAPGFDQVPAGKLVDILSVADLGVDVDVMPLVHWVAGHWAGPLRNVLASATPERKKLRHRHTRRNVVPAPAGPLADAVLGSAHSGGALLNVPPLSSALTVVEAAATLGTVLVLCPTLRMARLGAAWLRRRGFTTAELPDDIESALSGVNVVIGARSAALAGCAGLSSIVVIDEHEEAYHEERVPTWWAPHVAVERARRAGIPVWLTSAVPSDAAGILMGPPVECGGDGWPIVECVNLLDVPVKGSLLSSDLIDAVRGTKGPVLCVLNTKGSGRLFVCKSCRSLQACDACGTAAVVEGDRLVCPACSSVRPAVCAECGRTVLVAARAGVASLCSEIQKATGRQATEVTASTPGVGEGDGVWVGTDALLHRVPGASVVVFLDVDRELSAPRMSAGRDVLASVARAARLTGARGRVLVQTRQPGHPLLAALFAGDTSAWLRAQSSTARALGLPPFSSTAVCTFKTTVVESSLPEVPGVQWSLQGNVLSARSPDHRVLLGFVEEIRSRFGHDVRVAVNPPRQ